ncbi:universal stress protein [Lysobacter gummosus]|uniref:Universal stress protein n=1 Tax=Lysobacter gummosus TaxID=262324 RepID=A0ABY3XJ50_9GAMM|nr:universal stress protein [Lysobacter gummosus]ALN91240.1 universal stress family protein [Lysobacter gummosus]UNP31643.1 universal stress protein [Lysobacter gummosus]
MFKDFLVPLLMGDIPSPVVHTACAIAKAWRGRVIALVGVSQAAPIPEAWSYYPAGVYQNMRDCALATTQSMAEAADARLHYEGVPYEIRRSEAFWSTPEEISVEHARYADVTVLGMDTNEHDARHRLFAAVAVGSGRPVLCVPAYKALPADFGHAVVAWKPSREAARALRDALPWLARMRSVDLLSADETSSTAHPLDASLPNYLERHGVQVKQVRRSAAHASAGCVIVDHAIECNADLIVAGAYSRSRLVEQILGGTTRYLLDNAMCPVLFAH